MRLRYKQRPQNYDIMRSRVYGPVNKTMYLLECRTFFYILNGLIVLGIHTIRKQ